MDDKFDSDDKSSLEESCCCSKTCNDLCSWNDCKEGDSYRLRFIVFWDISTVRDFKWRQNGKQLRGLTILNLLSYNSGSLILAMENAGQLIDDEDLREQIKGSGIGTSATRAEIVKKLISNKYIALNKKTSK